MQRIIVEVGSKNTNIDVCYKEETKHIMTQEIKFEENYKKEGKLDKKDIDTLIERVKILNVVYYDINIYGTGIFKDLKEDEKKKFVEYFKEQTGRKFEILNENEEKILLEKGVEYLANKNN